MTQDESCVSRPSSLDENNGAFELDSSLHAICHYPCVHDGTKGTLFVGTGAVAFVGWTLFHHKRIDIHWQNVLCVKWTDSSISIVTHDTKKFDFECIQDSEQAWNTLVSLQKASSSSGQSSIVSAPLPSLVSSCAQRQRTTVFGSGMWLERLLANKVEISALLDHFSTHHLLRVLVGWIVVMQLWLVLEWKATHKAMRDLEETLVGWQNIAPTCTTTQNLYKYFPQSILFQCRRGLWLSQGVILSLVGSKLWTYLHKE